MKLARIALAFAAAALLSCQGGAFGGGSTESVRGVWLLVPAESSIWFVGIKNNAVAVPGSFTGLEGGIDVAKSEAWVEVRVATLGTGDEKRDENLRTHFFDAVNYPVARFAATGIPHADALPPIGADLTTTLTGKLTIRGKEFPLELPVRVTHLSANRLRVRNVKPLVLSAKDLGLEQALAVLKAVCGHEALSGAVPVEIDVVFTPI